MAAFLAVDAGNSKTVALVTDATGRVLGRGRGGNGDMYAAPTIPDAVEAMFGAVDAALSGAGLGAGDIASAAFRIAGVDYPEDGLGNSALKAVAQAWMGIAPPTALTAALCELYGVADGWELRHAFTRRFGLPRPVSSPARHR